MNLRLALTGAVVARWIAVGGRLAGLAAQSATVPPAPSTAQHFDTKAEIVLVDVTVVDAKGKPGADLRPEEFVVSVAGRPRPIQSARFVSTLPTSGRAEPANPREALTTTNEARSSGRLLLIVVDEGHLRFGANRAVLRTAERLIERMAPGDLIGVARLPNGGGVEFTTDRARIIAGLRGVTGQSSPRWVSLVNVYMAEAADFENGRRSEWPLAIQRECVELTKLVEMSYEPCVAAMEAQARQVLADQSQRTSATIRALEGLFSRLEPLDTPVGLVLISEGL